MIRPLHRDCILVLKQKESTIWDWLTESGTAASISFLCKVQIPHIILCQLQHELTKRIQINNWFRFVVGLTDSQRSQMVLCEFVCWTGNDTLVTKTLKMMNWKSSFHTWSYPFWKVSSNISKQVFNLEEKLMSSCWKHTAAGCCIWLAAHQLLGWKKLSHSYLKFLMHPPWQQLIFWSSLYVIFQEIAHRSLSRNHKQLKGSWARDVQFLYEWILYTESSKWTDNTKRDTVHTARCSVFSSVVHSVWCWFKLFYTSPVHKVNSSAAYYLQ